MRKTGFVNSYNPLDRLKGAGRLLHDDIKSGCQWTYKRSTIYAGLLCKTNNPFKVEIIEQQLLVKSQLPLLVNTKWFTMAKISKAKTKLKKDLLPITCKVSTGLFQSNALLEQREHGNFIQASYTYSYRGGPILSMFTKVIIGAHI